MARVSHIAVHVVAAADAIGLEEARDRGRGCDGLGDRHVLEGIEPKDHPLAPVEMDGRDEERAPTLTKAVGQALGREGLAHEALQWLDGEEAGRHVRSAPREKISHSRRNPVTAFLPMAHTNWARLRAALEKAPLW